MASVDRVDPGFGDHAVPIGGHARHDDNAGTSGPAQAFFSRASAIRLTVTPPITTAAPTRTGSSGDSA